MGVWGRGSMMNKVWFTQNSWTSGLVSHVWSQQSVKVFFKCYKTGKLSILGKPTHNALHSARGWIVCISNIMQLPIPLAIVHWEFYCHGQFFVDIVLMVGEGHWPWLFFKCETSLKIGNPYFADKLNIQQYFKNLKKKMQIKSPWICFRMNFDHNL